MAAPRLRLIAGEAMGARSPVLAPMAMFQADLRLAAGASAPLDAVYEERALYTSPAPSRSRATASGRASSWCSAPATASRSALRADRRG